MSTALRPPTSQPAAIAKPPPRSASLRALVRRGLRDHRRAPLTWGGALSALSAMILFTWPSIEDSVGTLVESYPEGLKEAFGIGDLDSVEAYFDAEMLSLIVPLAVAFLAVRTVSRGISTAEERTWLETLLATPLSRSTLVAGAFLVTGLVVAAVLALSFALALVAGLIVAAVLALSLLLTIVAGLVSGTDPSPAVIGRGIANVWPLAMFFAGLAALVAGRFHSAATVTAVAGGALVAMYLIDVLGRVADGIEPLRWASAFRYYGSAVRDGIDPFAFAGLAVAGAALAALGALLLSRRDIAG